MGLKEGTPCRPVGAEGHFGAFPKAKISNRASNDSTREGPMKSSGLQGTDENADKRTHMNVYLTKA